VIGTRPQIIKYSAVSKHLNDHDDVLIHTGQHYDYNMNQAIFDDLGVQKPQHNLAIGSESHGYQTDEAIKKIEKVLLVEQPDLTLVYGDCNSTLAGAIASVKLKIPVGHVEAGLRTYDLKLPEEVNRRLTDHCSRWCFAPTTDALMQLQKEGIDGYHVGDVMYDAFREHMEKAKQSTILAKHGLKANNYYLATVHRADNTDNPKRLYAILRGLSDVDKKVVFPLHPRTEKLIQKHFLKRHINDNIQITKPVSYTDMICLEMNASKIITDSGGVQTEAYFLRKPCVVLRDKNEYPSLFDNWHILTGTNQQRIHHAILNFMPGNQWLADFGDGDAGRKIVDILEGYV